MRIIFLILFFVSFALQAQDLKINSSEALNDAQSAFLKGELFDSVRYYNLVLENKPQSFGKTDILNFVSAAQVVYSDKAFSGLCNNKALPAPIQSTFVLACGRAMLKNGFFSDGIKLLGATSNEKDSFESHIFKATANLNSGKRDLCLSNLEKAQNYKDITLEEKELRSVTQARCELMLSKYNNSVKSFHELNARSQYYLSTLEEQAWAQFKRRDLDSSRELLSALSSYYEGQLIKNVTDDTYYKSRYLKGYLELISNNSEKSKMLLKQLSEDLKKYQSQNKYSAANIKNIFAQIKDIDNISRIADKQFKLLGKIRAYVSSWDAISTTTQTDNGIRFIVAINKEINRIEKLDSTPEIVSYKNKLLNLKKASVQKTAQILYSGVKSSDRVVESLLFKSNMGQLENFWAERTEGKRTLAEVLEDYKYGIMQVEDYLDR